MIGIVKQQSSVIEFQPKNKDVKIMRRTVCIYDDTMNEVEVTLYGQLTSKYEYNSGEIYEFKNLKVTEFQNQRNLVSSFASSVHRDERLQES